MAKNPLVVPAPSSTGRQHAHQIAKALTDITGWDYLDCLKKEDVLQKQKSRLERKAVQVDLVEKPPPRDIILVDDLVTTGATAHACAKAISNSKSIEIWAPYRTVLLC